MSVLALGPTVVRMTIVSAPLFGMAGLESSFLWQGRQWYPASSALNHGERLNL
jgi:hypothetical protein